MLTVVAVPATTLRPTLTVTDPDGVGVGSVTARRPASTR